MGNLRLWIVLLALTAFGGGLGIGWFAANRDHEREARARNSGPFAGFQAEFERTFKPSAERSRLLQELLAVYEREIHQLEQAHLENGRSDLEAKLDTLALNYRERIRDNVLPADKRSEYDRLAGGLDWKAKN